MERYKKYKRFICTSYVRNVFILYEYYETVGRDRWSSWLLQCRIPLYLIGRAMIIIIKTSSSFENGAVNLSTIKIFEAYARLNHREHQLFVLISKSSYRLSLYRCL